MNQSVKLKNPYLTPVNTAMVLLNVAVFIVLDILGDTTDAQFMFFHGAMYPPALLVEGQWYRLITCAFIHFGFSHLINNMILLICLGSYLEKALGSVKYSIFYVLTAIGSNLFSCFYMMKSGDLAVSGGASGVIFGVMGGLLFIVLRHGGRFQNLTLKRFALMLALSLYYGFSTAGVDNAAHVGGLIVGFILGIILYREKQARKLADTDFRSRDNENSRIVH